MNGNKKSAKQYHQSVITALEKKVNDMKDSAYSGLYSEIAFIIGIAVIMIDTFFPPEETKVNCVWKIILIAVSIVCMLYFAKKVKTVNEVEEVLAELFYSMGNKFRIYKHACSCDSYFGNL